MLPGCVEFVVSVFSLYTKNAPGVTFLISARRNEYKEKERQLPTKQCKWYDFKKISQRHIFEFLPRAGSNFEITDVPH